MEFAKNSKVGKGAMVGTYHKLDYQVQWSEEASEHNSPRKRDKVSHAEGGDFGRKSNSNVRCIDTQ